jgi:hypothetical protein
MPPIATSYRHASIPDDNHDEDLPGRAQVGAPAARPGVGPWLPEPVSTPGARAGYPDSLPRICLSRCCWRSIDCRRSMAAFLLHDVDCSFSEAPAPDRSEAHAVGWRRARAHVRDAAASTSTVRDRSEPSNHQQLVSAFVKAARSGDLQTLMSLLADDGA